MQVASLTVEELKLLIKETVSEAVQSLLIENDLIDPDIGKQIRPEFAAQLRDAIHQAKKGESNASASVVAKELGFDWDEL